MSEEAQAPTAPPISPLTITNPDFVYGFQLGCQVYEEYESHLTFTDRDIEIFLKDCLNIKKYKRARRIAKRKDWPQLSHAFDAGFVVGWLSRMLLRVPPYLNVSIPNRLQENCVVDCALYQDTTSCDDA